eukprot:7174289-Prymnesium_polylepis.2
MLADPPPSQAAPPATYAPTATAKPEPLVAFQAARTHAAQQLLSLGAISQATALAEAFHDHRTLAMLATRPPPLSAVGAAAAAAHPTPPAELRHRSLPGLER